MREEIGLIREVRTLMRERDEARSEWNREVEKHTATQAQNRRLRDALQRIADNVVDDSDQKEARRALEDQP